MTTQQAVAHSAAPADARSPGGGDPVTTIARDTVTDLASTALSGLGARLQATEAEQNMAKYIDLMRRRLLEIPSGSASAGANRAVQAFKPSLLARYFGSPLGDMRWVRPTATASMFGSEFVNAEQAPRYFERLRQAVARRYGQPITALSKFKALAPAAKWAGRGMRVLGPVAYAWDSFKGYTKPETFIDRLDAAGKQSFLRGAAGVLGAAPTTPAAGVRYVKDTKAGVDSIGRLHGPQAKAWAKGQVLQAFLDGIYGEGSVPLRSERRPDYLGPITPEQMAAQRARLPQPYGKRFVDIIRKAALHPRQGGAK